MAKFTAKEVIELAARTEKEAAEFYGKLAEKFKNEKELAEIFTFLQKDELSHEKQFSNIADATPLEDANIEGEDIQSLLQATAASEFFKADALKVDSGLTVADALQKALDFEKASLLHYMTLHDEVPNEWLKAIVNSEKKHVKTLMKVIISDARFRGLSDRWE